MTKAMMALSELAEKAPDTDLLRQMIEFVAQRMMELDVEGLCGAGYDEKGPGRLNSRNGFRDRPGPGRPGSARVHFMRNALTHAA